MTFGERLMSLRRARGLSQEALGDMLDVTRQTVSKWERGDSTPELEKLVELSRIFGVSLDELIKGDVEEMKQEINAQERAGFNRDTVCFAVLGITSVLALAPLVALWDLMGALIWGLLFSSACYFCGRVELYKKMFDIQTYKEILAFQQGADMTALTAVRAERDPRRQRASKAVMVVVAAVFGSAIAYGGMWLLDTLGLF